MHSEYDPATGLFTGRRFSRPCEAGPLATLLEGHFDHLSQRVAVDLLGENGGPVVVPYQPPAPPDDELRTWAWDQTSKRWRSTPTTAAIAADVRAERYRRMVAADWVTLRAVRTGTPVPTVWATYLQLLADLPEQAGFPHTITWPVPPDETQGRITP